MLNYNLDNFIPIVLQRKVLNTVIEFLFAQVEDYLGAKIALVVNELHSDSEFEKKLVVTLKKGIENFQISYFNKDEDLVNAILSDADFFENFELQESLLTVLKSPGQYYKKERDIVFQKFPSVLPQRQNRERVDTAVTYLLRCIVKEIWNLSELQPAYKLQFTRMSPEEITRYSLPQKIELQEMTVQEEIKKILLNLAEAIVERRLRAEVQNEPLVLHNLPRHDHTRFIGRDAEFQEIQRRLSSNDRHFIITVDGVGGIGKSSIALQAADYYLRAYYNLPERERFDAIIWTSAKRTVLTAEGITNRVQSLRTLEDIYTTIAVTLEREDIIRSPVELQDDLIRYALTHKRILLIVDNLETVYDKRIMNFIREIPSPTKAIVTTRHRIDTALPIRLPKMSSSESEQLIAAEAESRNLTLTNKQRKDLAKHTGGVPLAIVWSISLLAYGYSLKSVLERLKKPTGDLAKFCFAETIRFIEDKPAYSLLCSLSLFTASCTRNMLGYVAGISEIERDDGLVELEKLSLVNRNGNEFSLLPLTRVYSQSELERDKVFAKSVIERGTRYLTSLLKMHPDWYWFQDQAEILEHGENYQSLLDWADEYDDVKSFANIIRPSVLFLDYTGRRGKASELATYGKNSLASHPDYYSIFAWLCVKNAWILSQSELSSSRKSANSDIHIAVNTYEKLGDIKGECFARCFYAQILRHQGKYQDALSILQDVRDSLEKMDDAEGHILLTYELGKLRREKKEWDSAYIAFKIAHETLLRQSQILHSWFSLTKLAIHGNYAEASFEMGYYDEAQQSVEQVLADLNRWKRFNLATNYWARMHLLAAQINIRINKRAEARIHALEAYKLGSSTKNEKLVHKSEQILQNESI